MGGVRSFRASLFFTPLLIRSASPLWCLCPISSLPSSPLSLSLLAPQNLSLNRAQWQKLKDKDNGVGERVRAERLSTSSRWSSLRSHPALFSGLRVLAARPRQSFDVGLANSSRRNSSHHHHLLLLNSHNRHQGPRRPRGRASASASLSPFDPHAGDSPLRSSLSPRLRSHELAHCFSPVALPLTEDEEEEEEEEEREKEEEEKGKEEEEEEEEEEKGKEKEEEREKEEEEGALGDEAEKKQEDKEGKGDRAAQEVFGTVEQHVHTHEAASALLIGATNKACEHDDDEVHDDNDDEYIEVGGDADDQ